ncbi:MAG: sigma-54 interaction domain-containing protein [bacterium]|jgi:two-component system response regulator PilR (NtrC family)
MNSLVSDIMPVSVADVAYPEFSLLGQSSAIREARAHIARLAKSSVSVVIYGESGTGKELAARDIHALSARSQHPFITVNCGAIPDNLMESEFFGARRGAFTGAVEDRSGFFHAAHGGTLFLDEVAELPVAMQVKLLRVIQEGKVRKLGGAREEAVDVRILSATHRNLAHEVQNNHFRQDLYYRLNVIELRLPPLRERRDDIPLLCETFLRRQESVMGKMKISPDALAILVAHDYPGNVRELQNVLERASAFATQGQINADDLMLGPSTWLGSSKCINHASSAMDEPIVDDKLLSLPEKVRVFEREIILQALRESRYKQTRTAHVLGISLRQLRYRMQRLHIHDFD